MGIQYNITKAAFFRKAVFLLPLLIFAFWQRRLILHLLSQLFLGALTALVALPLSRPLEKRMNRGKASALALAGLIILLVSFVLLLVPFLAGKMRQIASSLPNFLSHAESFAQRIELWLMQKGIPIEESWKTSLFSRGEALLVGTAKVFGGWVQNFAGSLGRWLLAPVFAFYLLRDRREIGEWILMLLPKEKRGFIVRILREIRRETFGFLRAQLLISAAIGVLTALGLLLCGIPGWLFLGIMMALLELIPYIGPAMGTVLVLLFSWQEGLSGLLWSLGVVLLVQQIEGNLLSPRLTGRITGLHPLAVLIGVLAGGSVAGIAGILLAVPFILCLRAIFRVISSEQMERRISAAEEYLKQNK